LQIEWNPWLGGYCPQISVLSALCPQLNLLNPPKKISGYATGLFIILLPDMATSLRKSYSVSAHDHAKANHDEHWSFHFLTEQFYRYESCVYSVVNFRTFNVVGFV
jgi:hypothetical protein